MNENNPNERKSPNDNISEQLNELGKNLREALQSAWESEERRKLQKEIEDGLANLGASLSEAAKDFSSSPTGQSLKEDVKDLQERWRTGEVRSKAHSEIVEALRKVNIELQKATKKSPPPPADKPGA
jgi:signal recognition particle GTPase